MRSVLQLQSVLRENELPEKIETRPMTRSLWKRGFVVQPDCGGGRHFNVALKLSALVANDTPRQNHQNHTD